MILPFTYLFTSPHPSPPDPLSIPLSLRSFHIAKESPRLLAENLNIPLQFTALDIPKTSFGSVISLTPIKAAISARAAQLESEIGIPIHFGYSFELSFEDMAKVAESPALYHTETLFNKLYREFYEKAEKKKSFLGPIELSLIRGYPKADARFLNPFLTSYIHFALKFNVALIFDVGKEETPEILRFLSDLEEEYKLEIESVKKVLFFLNFADPVGKKIEFRENSKITIETHENADLIRGLCKRGYQLGISLRNFQEGEDLRYFLEGFDQASLENLIVSPCLEFRSDLTEFGGNLLPRFVGFSEKNCEAFRAVLVENPKKLLREKVVQIKAPQAKSTIQCFICSNEFETHGGKVSKDGHEFCSLECFKLYLKSPHLHPKKN